jgi:hypothetical protein
MPKPMQSLADFKRRAKPGARFERRFLSDPVKPRIVTVAYTQSNAAVFVPQGFEPAPEILAEIAQNPQAYGSWFYFPKARACRFKDGELIALDSEGRPFLAFKPVSDAETHRLPGASLSEASGPCLNT